MEIWNLSRYCEDFGCTPATAVRDLYPDETEDVLPSLGVLVNDIRDLRNYAAAKHAIETAKKESDVPQGYWTEQVGRVMERRILGSTEE